MRFDLDLRREAPAPSRWGRAWLVAGVLLAALAALDYQQAESALAEAESARAAAQQRAARPVARAAAPLSKNAERAQAAEATSLRRVRASLDADWSGLLCRLERARSESVALLEVEAGVAERELKLTANAKDLPAMLEYLERLERRGLSNARLRNHAALQDGPEHVQRFSLQAGWPASFGAECGR